tara:strand:+ start:166 stop:573 length:408 start_codon:yes stop_codon:yes gene_type:complete
MKNKIFELYKPNSLAEFLELQKTNPDEKFVYVLQHPPSNINILGASDYGYLVICLPNYGPDSQIIFSSSPFVFKMQKNLRDFRQQDYVLLTGDPAIIGISCAIVCDKTNGKFNLLKWDRREAKYYPINFDLYQKG